MKYLGPILLGLLWVLGVGPAAAVLQALDCPTIVQTALNATDQLCDNTDRNQACYGHVLLQAQSQPNVSSFTFDQPGDKVDVANVRSLRLSPMEVTTGFWGIAQMHLQADLPSSQSKDVTLVMFGDVAVDNAVNPATQIDVTVATKGSINVRRAAAVDAGTVGVLSPGETVTAIERLADSSWLRVELPNSETTGWVFASLLTTTDAIGSLNVAEAWSPHYRPMQAFYFKSSADKPACPEAPVSGLLIQTPEGVGKVKFLINEVNIQIGSTVVFRAQSNGDMVISTVEGEARVETQGVARVVPAGTQVRVPLNDGLQPTGQASLPEPYNLDELQGLPLSVLDRKVEIHPPLSYAQIDQLFSQEVSTDNSDQDGGCTGESCNAPGQGGSCPGASCDTPPQSDACPDVNCEPSTQDTTCTGDSCNPPVPPPSDPNCPGQSCDAPGQGGTCPGDSCDAPGQGGTCPGNSCKDK